MWETKKKKKKRGPCIVTTFVNFVKLDHRVVCFLMGEGPVPDRGWVAQNPALLLLCPIVYLTPGALGGQNYCTITPVKKCLLQMAAATIRLPWVNEVDGWQYSGVNRIEWSAISLSTSRGGCWPPLQCFCKLVLAFCQMMTCWLLASWILIGLRDWTLQES